jgi:hypothetical protein
MKYITLFIITIFLLLSMACSHGEIQVENNLENTVIKNIEWGNIPVTEYLLPYENSYVRKINNSDYYDIKLPDTYSLRFYIEKDSIEIYYETVEKFTIEREKYVLITINEDTELITLFEKPIN